MASGRLGLMGVRQKERHGKGQTAFWADIGPNMLKHTIFTKLAPYVVVSVRSTLA